MNKRILLVDESLENPQLRSVLEGLKTTFTMQVATSASDALSNLMGTTSVTQAYFQPSKSKPDYILINNEFLKKNGNEFLEVVRKYYSLKNIPVFIVGENARDLDGEITAKYGISGYLSDVSDYETMLISNSEGVSSTDEGLTNTGIRAKTLFAFPVMAINEKITNAVIQFFKGKGLLFQAGNTLATKVVVGVATTALAGTALSVATKPEEKKTYKHQIVVQTVPFESTIPKESVAVPEEATVVTETPKEKTARVQKRVSKPDVVEPSPPEVMVNEPQPVVVDEIAAPVREFKIKVMAEAEEGTN